MIDWVSWDSYEVYSIPNLDPSHGDRVQRVNPFDALASPKGWLDQGTLCSSFVVRWFHLMIDQKQPLNNYFMLLRIGIGPVHYYSGKQRLCSTQPGCMHLLYLAQIIFSFTFVVVD